MNIKVKKHSVSAALVAILCVAAIAILALTIYSSAFNMSNIVDSEAQLIQNQASSASNSLTSTSSNNKSSNGNASSFDVTWTDKAVPENTFVSTVNYGYIDDDGNFQSLPAPYSTDLQRDFSTTNDGNSSFVNLEIYNDTIQDGSTTYILKDMTIFDLPDTNSGKSCTRFAYNKTSSSAGWSYYNGSWNTTSTTGNINLYLVYEKSNGQNPKSDFSAPSGAKYSNYYVQHHFGYIDDDGNYVDLPSNYAASKTFANTANYGFGDFSGRTPIYYNNTNYILDKAMITNPTTGTEATLISYNYSAGGWCYYYGGSWSSLGSTNQTIDAYLLFKPEYASLDSKSQHINMNMFDYDAWRDYSTSASSSNYWDGGINALSDFKFSAGTEVIFRINQWSSDWDKLVTPKIFNNLLGTLTGMPILTDRYKDEEEHIGNLDLSYLFKNDETNTQNYRQSYQNINNLFDYQKYQETGHFYFDSSQHFAYFNRNANRYFLSQHNKRDKSNGYFMPFDSEISSAGNDFHFSVVMDFDFMQPKDGQYDWEYGGTTTTQNMEFAFNGDDDIFVYIDDVLVLDIGGLHAALDGTINFNTGEVTSPDISTDTNNSSNTQTTNLKTIFEEAGKSESTEWKDNTFGDYTRHTMKIFYMERGQGQSNAKFDFNIASIEENTIQVGKTLVKNGSEIVYKDNEFEFLAQKKDATTGDYVNYSGTYDVYKGDVGKLGELVESGIECEGGVIKLKDGQVAVLSGFVIGDVYRVIEYDPYVASVLDKWKVNVNGSTAQDIVIEGKTYSGKVDVKTEDVAGLQFSDECKSYYDFYVKKKDETTGTDDSTVKIYFNNEQFLGSYYLVPADFEEGTEPTEYTEQTATAAGISFNKNEKILIRNVAPSVPFKVDTVDTAVVEGTKRVTYPSESPTWQYQVENTKQVTNALEGNLYNYVNTDKWSKVSLELSDIPRDLTITKEVTGDYGDKTLSFEIGCSAKTKAGTTYDPGGLVFAGVFTDQSGTKTNVEVVVVNGEIKIADSSSGTTVYKTPTFRDGEKLEVTEILPLGGTMTIFEKIVSGYDTGATLNDTTVTLTKGDTYISSGDLAVPDTSASVKFVNARSEVIPSAFYTDNASAAFLILAICGVLMLALLLSIKRNLKQYRRC